MEIYDLCSMILTIFLFLNETSEYRNNVSKYKFVTMFQNINQILFSSQIKCLTLCVDTFQIMSTNSK